MSLDCRYKVFATDLDDTLHRNDRTVAEYDMKMLQKLQEAGVDVVFCSGRSCYDVALKFAKYGLRTGNCFAIGSCGCEIASVENGEVIHCISLSDEAINIVIEYCEKNEYCIELFYKGKYVVSTKNNDVHMRHIESSTLQSLIVNYDEMKKLCAEEHPRKLLISETVELVSKKIFPEMNALIPKDSRLAVYLPFCCEVLPAKGTKSDALQWLCSERLKCKMDEVVSIGDGENDVQMLRDCGLSFAPSNSCDEAKKAAKRVLSWSNMECCVGRVINEIFFEGKYPIEASEDA
ncbi:putative haloacid dehalogenase-like hydrolase [Monocercomonoides exilis]|uniref:putative haloacid dehalogenase-like hydrolase n=1 Tax=Monocercomonoides exilis TaxID=2049356 RepID=UPI00355A347E|nr:putative haloacid dehalogenase-like hydrolase [Monocercomonoides exilis]|eukprot:MONOS_13601.1-p1 / transcript=MONOS_13601.1 / gene=MONOS_13601 / organism=Monocercomonoides_exilis_PA203 / gene_product=putative haloacid dehalogenase-like hydrolase / transcript_product=putative haloacid dehalogenase-like hydrolase / location=Mono_scaffold00852:5698-7001(+) / protein_length=290 / sequence_SO=supercontig / SO=protein_coding / is_pseudo=false